MQFTDNAKVILSERYLQNGESPDEMFWRVANAISKAEKTEELQKLWALKFFNLMNEGKFLPNSPTLVNAGTEKGCMSACFTVIVDDTMQSIMDVAHDAAMIEKWGGGIGFGLSRIRPKNDKISTVQGKACGPIKVMKLYSKVGETLTQGAFREGAHMAQLMCSHPNLIDFIHVKDNDDSLSNFNISVLVTDEFMKCVEEDKDWNFINPATNKVTSTMPAKQIWKELCESAWKTGDPGIAFIDRVWETQPNPQLGRIESSNPCSEAWLESYSSCNLGSINLARFCKDSVFDFELFSDTINQAIRFLDDVVSVNVFPLDKLKEMNQKTRRIGLGIMGFADVLVLLGIKYDSKQALDFIDIIGEAFQNSAWDASIKLAKERGEFPEYGNSSLKPKFPPVRNSDVTTIAPTGTISRIAGCSSGIEPFFSLAWWSNILWKEGESTKLLDSPSGIFEFLTGKLGEAKAAEALTRIADNPKTTKQVLEDAGLDQNLFRTASDVSPEWHVKIQAQWQKYTTNGVSKTINMPNNATIKDVEDAYMLAWKTGCKSITIYRDGSKAQQVLETGNTRKRPVGRPRKVTGETTNIPTGHGNAYITINNSDNKPFELFATIGKAGGCDSAYLEAIARMVSLALRTGIEKEEIVKQLKGIVCCPIFHDGGKILSPADAIAIALLDGNAEQRGIIEIGGAIERVSQNGNGSLGNMCPQCFIELINQEGCKICKSCGWSKC